MNTKVTLHYLLAILVGATLFVSCSDDNDPSTPPSVTAPESQSVTVGGSVDLSFSVSTDNGYQSASVLAENGTAELTSEPEDGASSGNVVVSYTGNTSGAGSVELIVTDGEGLTDNATAVVSVGEEQTEVTVTDNITSDQTWEDGVEYILAGRISVEAGATLTIEGGAIVKGQAGEGANATALLIARGATLNANGAANAPIIFTSVADEITPEDVDNGNFGSPNLSPTQRGLWGGLIILGNAPISVSGGTENQIEGIPSSDQNGLYGGDDPEDSSGSITFISIRHGGSSIGEGNEINGLTMGGVGTGTTIENVEVVANQDDGLEWFGGTVNVTNVLVWNNGDDAIDTDQAWSGTVSNIIIATPGDSPFELDGPEGSFTSSGHTIQNASVFVMGNGAEEMIDVDAETDVNMSNILFFGLTDGNTISSDFPEYANNTNGFGITSLEAVIPDGSSVADFFHGLESETTEVASVSAATVGATDLSAFSFTWSSQADSFPTEFGL